MNKFPLLNLLWYMIRIYVSLVFGVLAGMAFAEILGLELRRDG